jgi:uncharacterized protein YkwD
MKEPLHRVIHRHARGHAHKVFNVSGLVGLTLIIAGVFTYSVFIQKNLLASDNVAAIIASKLIELSNDNRADESIGDLTENALLVKAAQAKANDMAARGYFAHTTPDGKEPWHFISAAGYDYLTAGENLAMNFSDSEDVVRAWMRSPSHKENILNSRFTEIGIATAKGEYEGKETIFVVQMFGSPRSQRTVVVQETVTRSLPIADEQEETESVDEPIAEVPADVETEVLGETEVKIAQAPSENIGVLSTVADDIQASPHNFMRTIFLLCGFIILLALITVTGFEFKKHHIRHVATSGALIVLMIVLLYVADSYIFTAPIL